jgi:hypothetical protein
MTYFVTSCFTNRPVDVTTHTKAIILSRPEKWTLITDAALVAMALIVATLIALATKGVALGQLSSLGSIGMKGVYALVGAAAGVLVLDLTKLIVKMVTLIRHLFDTARGYHDERQPDQEEINRLQEQLGTTTQSLKEVCQQKEDLKGKLEIANQENEELKQKMSRTQKKDELTVKYKKLVEDYADKKRECLEIGQRIALLKVDVERTESLKEANKRSDSANDVKALTEVHQKLTEDIESKNNKIQVQIGSLATPSTSEPSTPASPGTKRMDTSDGQRSIVAKKIDFENSDNSSEPATPVKEGNTTTEPTTPATPFFSNFN